ncbi:MAG: VOC family protein [Planctomycetes bacterium]|nr:VOC family protein [Planctomycetota bacterium]
MMSKFDHLFIAPSDFGKSLAFYKDTLGWQHVAGWGGGDQGPRGAVLKSSGGMSVTIAEEHDAKDRSWSHGVNGNRPTVHLYVEDVDAQFEKLPAGEHVVIKPEDTHWGTRWFVVSDPDGNLIAFGKPRE